jgi:hypothetical protein
MTRTIRRETDSLDLREIYSNFYSPQNFEVFLKGIGGKLVTCKTNPSSGLGFYVYHVGPQNLTLTYEIRPAKKSTFPFSDIAEIEIKVEGIESMVLDVEKKILLGEAHHKEKVA